MLLKKSLSVLMLTVLFAFMQMGMVMHEVSHLEDDVQSTWVGSTTIDVSQEQSPSPDSTTHEHCAQCLAYAQVDGVVASSAFNVYLANSICFISAAYIAYLAAVTKGVYQARAPPSILN